jgi:protein O-mannosyl-transferase
VEIPGDRVSSQPSPIRSNDLPPDSAPPKVQPRAYFAVPLLLATVVLYYSALHYGFVNYDDNDYVTQNPHVVTGLTAANVRWSFTGVWAANWHPLTWISHMADVQMFGLNPAGHHATNILLHLVNVVLLFLLLDAATGERRRSAMVAALFAVHPLNVESVAWIAERKNLLSTTFLLLALLAYGLYVRKPAIARYLLVALLFALGLMAKAAIITLPFALLLLDYWPLQRVSADMKQNRRLVLEKFPLLLISAAGALITVWAQRTGAALGTASALPFSQRLPNAIYSYAVYLGKAIWPSALAVFYPHPENLLVFWKVGGAALLLIAITALVWKYRQRRYLVTGWLWFLGVMVPMIGIVQAGRQAMADRYAYITFWGLFVIAVWLVADWVEISHFDWRVLDIAAIFIFMMYVGTAAIQLSYWKNSFTLFSHALVVTENNGIAEGNLGDALVQMGRPSEAVWHFKREVELVPELSTGHYNYATILHREGNLAQALPQYELAIRYGSDAAELAQAHNNLAVLFAQSGRPEDARREYDATLALDTNKLNALLGRGELEFQQKEFDAAAHDFTRALELNPGLAQARQRLNEIKNKNATDSH